MVKTKIIELLDLIKTDLELSDWSKALTLKDQHKWFLDEVDELKEALAKEDMENYHEELGDVLWDLLKLILIAEKEGIGAARDIIEDVRKKISTRKPHLLNGKKVSVEEESKIWHEIKAKEKNERAGNNG
ncbi:MazG nucleotide pyrophosphohydrolase domain-containing protein [Nanoarchaeota archaeon]